LNSGVFFELLLKSSANSAGTGRLKSWRTKKLKNQQKISKKNEKMLQSLCDNKDPVFYHFHDNRNCRPAESLMTLGIVAACLAALSALRAELVTVRGAG
jgi:hypothetical protein